MKKLLLGLLTLTTLNSWSSTSMAPDDTDLEFVGKDTLSFTVVKQINILANTLKPRLSKNCVLELRYYVKNESKVSIGKRFEISVIDKLLVNPAPRTLGYLYKLEIQNYKKIDSINCLVSRDGMSVVELKRELASVLKLNVEENVIELY
jgi:hypothetical protein